MNMEESKKVMQCSHPDNTLQVKETNDGNRDLAKETNDDNRDRLSDLPDDLFDKIISFIDIDMSTLVQASLISKRWRYLWLSVPNLNFDKHTWKYRKPISGFVDKVLQLRNASDINKLSLTFPFYHCVANIGSWISYALSHQVQEIHVTGVIINTDMLFNLHVKTLKLSHLLLQIPKMPKDIVLNLPITEHLDIEHLYVSAQSYSLTICAPRLKTIVLDNARDQPHSIDIHCPDLMWVKSEGYLYQDFFMENVSSLRRAELSIFWNDLFTQDGLNNRVSEVLRVLSNAETLTLCVRHFEEPETVPKLLRELKKLQRPYGNVRYLDLKSRHNNVSDTELLEVFPNVTSIKRKEIV